MIKKVVYFTSSILYWRDFERFGAEILIENGFEVVFYNFTPFMYPLLYSNGSKENRYYGDKQKIFFSEAEALSETFKLPKDCFVISLLHYRHDTFIIYKALSKSNTPYAFTLLSHIPTAKVGTSAGTRFFDRILKLKLSRLPMIFKNYLFQPKYARYLGIRNPAILLAGGERTMNHPQFLLAGKQTDILWLHTFDYDIYLKRKIEKKPVVDNNKAVFIDAPSPRFAHNALIPGISSPLTEEKYYPSLCRFFDRLEKELGLTVEIAAHPASSHEEYPDYFGKRRVLHGQTAEMIRQSRLVITRNSTSTCFAVLYNKPVIFHTSSELENSEKSPMLSGLVHSMSSWYGKKAINIDESLNINWQNELVIDNSAYARYKMMFIKSEKSEDIYLWQAVANRLKKNG